MVPREQNEGGNKQNILCSRKRVPSEGGERDLRKETNRYRRVHLGEKSNFLSNVENTCARSVGLMHKIANKCV